MLVSCERCRQNCDFPFMDFLHYCNIDERSRLAMFDLYIRQEASFKQVHTIRSLYITKCVKLCTGKPGHLINPQSDGSGDIL